MEATRARIYVPDPETGREIEDYLTEAAGLLENWGVQTAAPKGWTSRSRSPESTNGVDVPICGVSNETV